MRLLWICLLFLPLATLAQKKQITLEDIYKKGTFRPEFFGGFDTQSPDSLFNPADVRNEKGEQLATDDFERSPDGKRLLFFDGREPIYRRSSWSNAWVYDVATKKTVRLREGKVLHPTFSPDGSKVAYVFENNLYIYDISAGKTTPVTTDGKWNVVINGNCDWVYEEEFEFTRAFEWSPAGTHLAYYRFDESAVKEYNLTLYNSRYNTDYRYKYPKAGEDNSKVDIYIYNLATSGKAKAQYEGGDVYIPRIKWTRDDSQLVVFWMNRHQNHLKLLLTDAATGSTRPFYEERNKYYVEINDNWWFLKSGKGFLFTSEMGGNTQLYHYSLDGKKKLLLSKMKYDIAEVNGVDEANGLVYYTLAYPTPMDRNLFVSDLSGKTTRPLTTGSGWHRVELNGSFSQFYDYYSTINTPQVVTLYTVAKGRNGLAATGGRVVNDNSRLKATLARYDLGTAEFLKVPTSRGDSLNAWMLKPPSFNPAQKYPVLFCNYGGPGSQQVANRFGAASYWHQLMAQKGFIVVSVDNTGTGFRGEEFKKKTYLQLGKLEVEDQIDAAGYLGTLPYVDKNRIGHWGWSFGGFLSSLAISKGAGVFRAAVAVAPVTSWRFYDNIYTERFMRTPQENPDGYDNNSPINHVDKIRGPFLIIHGTGDDNVHFQNSVLMVEAMVQKGIPFESAYYPNKTHSISGGNTSYHLWSRMTDWLLRNLKDNPEPVAK
ncbi:DPP IV N-terminal domain-containing protein [Paraflavisolibacter sp. H34]|uniref:S9 family peptidase n=1 Tax=Huijunlia imazamoxiresistens TaxID=3127457 RepID=UPI00301890D9